MTYRVVRGAMALWAAAAWAAGPEGAVTSAGLPIPGAQVTAVRGDESRAVYTDENGRYRFDALDGEGWRLRVEMFGFEPAEQSWDGAAPALDWSLELRAAQRPAADAPAVRPGLAALRERFQRVEVNIAERLAEFESEPFSEEAFGDRQLQQSANESYLVNGSVSRGLDAPPMAPGFGFGGPLGMGLGGPGGGPGDLFGGGDSPAPSIFGDASGLGIPGAGAGPGPSPGGPVGGPGGLAGPLAARIAALRGSGPGGPGAGRGGPPGRRPGGPPGGEGRQMPEWMRQRAAMVFGNRANRNRTPVRGSVHFSWGNSALDATPYSVSGERLQKPSYAQGRLNATVGGQLKIPKLVEDRKTFWFFTYQGGRSRNPFSNFATMPSELERAGDFSRSIGRGPVSVFDPLGGARFPNDVVPASRLDPAALGLSEFIPPPNLPGNVRNYQFVSSFPRNNDSLSLRLNRSISNKDRLAFSYSAQWRNAEQLQLFGFRDASDGAGVNTSLGWTRNIRPNLISNARVAFTRDRNALVPFFAFGDDVAGRLGIAGASRNPLNFGPPNLSFTNFGDLRDGAPSRRTNRTFSLDEGLTIVKGEHTMRFGGSYRRLQINSVAEPDGRGSFMFSGLATSAFAPDGRPVRDSGFDFADFLLGLPQSSSIRFGNADTYFRASAVNFYLQDDWRANGNLSFNYGLRYEFQPPFREKYGRLANLDVAPGFAGAAPVLSGQAGPFTGAFPAALIEADANNFAPRFGFAWKPSPKRSTVLRGGYGVYYNGSVYNQAAARLAQQPPFAVTTTLVTGVDRRLTLADGLAASPDADILNTFAVDRRYRVGYAQTWNFSLQQSLPASMVLSASYLGTKGTRLDIQRAPNRTAAGLPEGDRRIANAVGFVYDSAEGNSVYHAGQVRLIRRFRNGISGNLQYTWAKSLDNVSSFGGAGGAVVALYDDNLSLERGRSSFDVRHAWSAGWAWTSPASQGAFGAPPKNWRQRALKSWTIAGGLSANSGAPLTATVLGNQTNSGGSGVVGSGRADATGLPVRLPGAWFNPAAFTTPPSERLGNAGRNTIPGPDFFAVNLSVGRTFRLDDNRRSLEVRAASENLTNRVNIRRLGTTVNASNFGLPVAAADMRQITLSVRLRF